MTGREPVGTLESVNVGRPRDITWRGRQVRTAIDKRPVPGRVQVDRLNVAGDGQADLVGHGGEHRAVFVYQRESYRHWQVELGLDLPRPGLFGENFTVTGLADDSTRIGDRLAVGTVELEVTQPRVTCYKVGIALGTAAMPGLLTRHGRPGFYVRVLQEGTVRAGDELIRLSRAPDSLTVRQTSDLLYGADHEPDLLRRSIDTTALPEGWRSSFRALLSADPATGNAGLTAAATPPSWTGFRAFRLVEARDESPTVRSLQLAPADGSPLPSHQAGQFVTVRIPGTGRAAGAIRSYTVSAGNPRALRISVRRAGEVSTRLHELTVGDAVDIAAPRGTSTLPPGSDDHDGSILLASAGIGITPMIAALAALVDEPGTRRVSWLHVARSADDDPFAVETGALLAQLPDSVARTHYTGARDPMSAAIGRGRPTLQDLRALGLTNDTHAMLCGPPGFMNDLRTALLELGLAADHIHTETFGAASAARTGRDPHPPRDEPAQGIAVTFARTGLTVNWSPRHGTLLDLAEACDVPARWSCRSGVCHQCQTGLISGSVEYDPLPLDPPPDETTLICSATPHDAVVLDL